MHVPTLIIAIITAFPRQSEAVVACNETHNRCEELLWKGSQCRDGFCTNPFQGGCLRAMLDSEEYEHKYSSTEGFLQSMRQRLMSKPRVCNSEDGQDVIERGSCVKGEADYPEVRIYSQNWESAMLLAWIMQIIYSELVGVPSTIESGMADKNLNFYEGTNRMDYGTGNDVAVFQNAHDAGGNCGVYKKSEDDGDKYVPCAHLVMESWNADAWKLAMESGAVEAMQLVGMVGYEGWHITLFSMKKDPSLATYFGLRGEDNRRKLAETFKRPTTWNDYCALVSTNNCSTDDGVAKRAPAEDGSENKYFSSGLYTGHFRATEKNDCDANPTTCTGHILDYPCGWTSYLKQQAKHLGIAVEGDGPDGGGYSYENLIDIWHAANATKSDVIGYWWAPQGTVSLFSGSGSDLTPVSLPLATQECLENRVDITKRCDPDATDFDIYGDSKGSCGQSHVQTIKVSAENIKSNIIENENPKARMSPAYEAYENFIMYDVQVNDILVDWMFRGVDKDNFDLRFATCKWMVDNLDHVIKSFVPPSHPRTFVPSNNSVLSIAALVLGVIAVLVTLSATGGILYKHRKGTVGTSAQIMFLLLLLVGLLMVSVGSVLLALEPSTGTCVGSIWMINVGYTTQLVPTLIRVSTIIKIVRSSMKMKIVKVNKNKLVGRSIGISAIAAIYSLFWTIFDTPHSQTSLQVTQDQNELGETIVEVSHHCDSESSVWFFAMFLCQALLLLCASVLAHQMRQVPNSVNDSKPLAIMIYSSVFFLALRFVVYAVSGTVGDDSQAMKTSFQMARSIFCSLDTVSNVLIFFSRFFLAKKTIEKPKAAWAKSTKYVAKIISNRGENNACSEPVSTAPDKRPSLVNPHHPKPRVQFAEEEKEEEECECESSSSTIRIRMRNRKSVTIPFWVVEEYGAEIADGSEFTADESDNWRDNDMKPVHGGTENTD